MDENYQAFLLRMRRNETAVQWRITLENVHTGESKQFLNETALLHYLLELLNTNQPQGASPHDKQDKEIS